MQIKTGGWLSFFCFYFIVVYPWGAFANVGQILDMQIEMAEQGVDVPFAVDRAISINLLMLLILASTSFFAAFRVWLGSPFGKRIAVRLLWFLPLITIAGASLALLPMEGFSGPIPGAMREDFVVRTVGTVILSAIWLIYFHVSKRVQRTYWLHGAGEQDEPQSALASGPVLAPRSSMDCVGSGAAGFGDSEEKAGAAHHAGFFLGVRGKCTNSIHEVMLEDREQYAVVLGNERNVQCDVSLTVDGVSVGVFRIEPCSSVVIERPTQDAGHFTFYAFDTRAATEAGVHSSNENSGRVVAEFRPARSARDQAVPLQSRAPRPKASGGTGLSGKSDQRFLRVEAIELDEAERVKIGLWLQLFGGIPRPLPR
jgi:hypothetical protein